MARPTTGGVIGISLALLFIGLMTLEPTPELTEMAARTAPWCLVCGDLGTIDVIMNVLLFAPLGAVLYHVGLSRRNMVLLGFGISLIIELLQMTVLPGRDASLSDLITNTSGVLLGGWLASAVSTWLWPSPKTSRLLCYSSLLSWIGLTFLTAWALAPATLDRELYGQWAPELGGFHQFAGTVIEARAAGEPLPDGPFEDESKIREAMSLGTAELESTIRLGLAPSRLAPITTVVDGRQRILILLGQAGDDLVFAGLTRSSKIRLRTPAINLPGSLANHTVGVIHAGGRLDRRSLSAWVTTGDERRTQSLSLSPNWSWVLFFPFDIVLGERTPLLTGLWLVVLLLPISYWTLRSRQDRAGWALWGTLGGGLAVCLIGVPWMMGFDPVPPAEWVGAITGVVLGIVTGRYSMKLASPSPNGQAGRSG